MKRQIDPEQATALIASAFAGLGAILTVEVLHQLTEKDPGSGGGSGGQGPIESIMDSSKPAWWRIMGWPVNQHMDPNIAEKVGKKLTEKKEQKDDLARQIGEAVEPIATFFGWNRPGGVL